MITSESNPLIKKVKKLHSRAGRQKYGQYFVEGIRAVEQVLENGGPIEEVLYCEEVYRLQGGEALVNKLKESGIKTYQVSSHLFEKITDTAAPQYVLAVLAKEGYQLEQILENKDLLLVIVDGIQDPGNLGTIIRTADAAGAHGIILTKGTVDPYNPKSVRSTMGSIFSLPIIQAENAIELFKKLKASGIKLIGGSLQASTPYFKVDYRGKVALVIGSEAKGISEEVSRHIDLMVTIPMRGKVESLNAGIACGIILYKVVEQRLT